MSREIWKSNLRLIEWVSKYTEAETRKGIEKGQGREPHKGLKRKGRLMIDTCMKKGKVRDRGKKKSD